MSYIEGVGDEVTILFALMFLLILVYIVWLSTSVTDNPLIRVVILDRARFQIFLQRFALFRNNQRVVQTNVQNNPSVAETNDGGQSTTNDDTTDNVQPSRTVQTDNSSGNKDYANTLVTDPELVQSSVDTQAPPIPLVVPDTQLPTDGPSDVQTDELHVDTPQTEPHSDTRTDQLHVDTPQTEASHITQSVLDSFLRSTESSNIDQSEDRTAEVSGLSSSLPTESSTGHKSLSSSTPGEVGSSVDNVLPSGEQNEEQSSPQQQSPESANQNEADPSSVSDDTLLDGHIRIRLKYLDDRQKLVQARPEDTVGHFKSTHFAMELADNMGVRFIFRGQELREDRSTLQAYHVEDNSVVHCLLTRITRPEQPTNHHAVNALDMSFLMLPLFALILCLMWYCRFSYRSYFSAVSTLSLVGITFLFVVAVLATWRRDEVHEHQE